MYSLYCEEEQYQDWMVGLLARQLEDVRVHSTWEDFVEASRTARCSIVEAGDLSAPEAYGKLFRFCVYPTLRPLVLVTSTKRENARHLSTLCMDEVVWLNRIDQDLVRAVCEAEQRSFLAAFSDALEERSALPPRLKSAVILASQSPTPVRNQQQLAELSYCDRRTLIRQWNKITSSGSTLKEVLDWLVLLRAFEQREQGLTWKEVENSIGVRRRSVDRIALRLTGHRLGKLDLLRVESLFQKSAPYHAIIETFDTNLTQGDPI